MKTFIWVAIGWFIFSVIDVFWQGMELFFYGETHPSMEDTVFGFILTIAILIILGDRITIK